MILFTIFSNTFETAINYIQHATSKINIILQNISNSQISHTKKARQPTSLHVNCLSYVHLFFSFKKNDTHTDFSEQRLSLRLSQLQMEFHA